MYNIFRIHSSVKGHLSSFKLLAITNKAATNIRSICPYYQLEHILGTCPGEELLDFPVVFAQFSEETPD